MDSKITAENILKALNGREKGLTVDGIAWDIDVDNNHPNIKAIRKILTRLLRAKKISIYNFSSETVYFTK